MGGKELEKEEEEMEMQLRLNRPSEGLTQRRIASVMTGTLAPSWGDTRIALKKLDRREKCFFWGGGFEKQIIPSQS